MVHYCQQIYEQTWLVHLLLPTTPKRKRLILWTTCFWALALNATVLTIPTEVMLSTAIKAYVTHFTQNFYSCPFYTMHLYTTANTGHTPPPPFTGVCVCMCMCVCMCVCVYVYVCVWMDGSCFYIIPFITLFMDFFTLVFKNFFLK